MRFFSANLLAFLPDSLLPEPFSFEGFTLPSPEPVEGHKPELPDESFAFDKSASALLLPALDVDEFLPFCLCSEKLWAACDKSLSVCPPDLLQSEP